MSEYYKKMSAGTSEVDVRKWWFNRLPWVYWGNRTGWYPLENYVVFTSRCCVNSSISVSWRRWWTNSCSWWSRQSWSKVQKSVHVPILISPRSYASRSQASFCLWSVINTRTIRCQGAKNNWQNLWCCVGSTLRSFVHCNRWRRDVSEKIQKINFWWHHYPPQTI